MKKFIAGFVFCLISVVQSTAYADVYEPWPDEIPVPSVDFDDPFYSRFDVKVKIRPKSGTASILKQYEVGILVSDLTGFEPQRELSSTFYESQNYFHVKVEDLFPETSYQFVPYIVFNGKKCVASNKAGLEMTSLMRDQNSQWGDYSNTQTSIKIKGLTGKKRLQIWDGNEYVDITQDGYLIDNLDPRPWFGKSFGEKEGIERQFRLFIGEKCKIYNETLYTAFIRLDLSCGASPTGLSLKPKCNPGDADIQGLKLVSDVEVKELEADSEESIWYGGLEPNHAYTFQLYALVKSKNSGEVYEYPMRKYSKGSHIQIISFTTTPITFGEIDVAGVSSSATIASVSTNIDNRETNVGFMWKKYDAPSTLKPSKGFAALYDGILEGKIRNLQSQSYYDIRPFYMSKSGKYYYGEWVTFDPSDFSYIEPILKTYSAENIGATSVDLRGYILEGSDDIVEQGFEYGLYDDSGQSVTYNVQSSANSTRIPSAGQVMTIRLDKLLPDTSYCYRTYAITSKGEFFSESKTFKTDASAGIENVDNDEAAPTIVGYYSIQGYKFDSPQRGLNIVVYSDGSAKKIYLK